MSVEMNPAVAEVVASQLQTQAPVQQAPLEDVARFREAYAAAQARTPEVAPVPEAQQEGVRALLGALESLNGSVGGLGDLSRLAASKADLTPGDMLMLTVRCHQFLFHCQLTSNVANRSSDGVQQLFRQQS